MAVRHRENLHTTELGAPDHGKPQRGDRHHYRVFAYVHTPRPPDEAKEEVTSRRHFLSRRLRVYRQHLSCTNPSGNHTGGL